MAQVMKIKRIAVSVPETTARRIKAAARAVPVSTWVTEIIEENWRMPSSIDSGQRSWLR